MAQTDPVVEDEDIVKLKISNNGPIDRSLVKLYHDQYKETNFNKFVENEFPSYVLKSRYYREDDFYFIDFKSEQKMTEFLLKYQ